MRCVRDDGSLVWQKQTDRHAAYFALHDLTHFAVESVLGYQRGFFGLLREGWDFDDTTGKGPRGPLPVEAGEVEVIVAHFFAEHTSGECWPAEAFCESLPRKLTEDELSRVRARRNELFAQWATVEPGGVINLKFPS